VLDRARVRFVLVSPRAAGNVGAAARAIKNFGFTRLALAAPRCDPRAQDARSMAVDAADVLDEIREWPDLDTALAGARTVVGTTRRTGKHRRPHEPIDELARAAVDLTRLGEVAWVFGPEDNGLTDEDLDRCTHLAHVPTSHAFPSLNVAQAVLIAAYELSRAGAGPTPEAEPSLAPPADHVEREAMYRHLEQALLAIGFLGRDTHQVRMRRIRRALGRAALTGEEVRLLRGVARQTLWVAARAGLLAAEPDP
jgi:TrmH family RNA methyltransferase